MDENDKFEDICACPEHGHLNEQDDEDYLEAIIDNQPLQVKHILDSATR